MIDVFVPTLHRTSLRFCLKTLRKAGFTDVKLVENMVWHEACNHMALQSQSSWFLRVDEDMLLVKWSSAFMSKIAHAHPHCGIINFKLFDWRTSRPIRGIKLYRSDVAKSIKFHPDGNGRVDKIYSRRLFEEKIPVNMCSAIVGVHAETGYDEQLKSWKMRGEKDEKKLLSITPGELDYKAQMGFLETLKEPQV
jgi:hypothetical protein